MMMVITPATRQVEVSAAANGRPLPSRPRILGFTKMMYDMTMNVVSPARVSRLSDVFHCLNLKKRSSTLVEPASAAASMDLVLLQGGDSGARAGRVYRTPPGRRYGKVTSWIIDAVRAAPVSSPRPAGSPAGERMWLSP